ncbi:hypothetical protein ACO0LL_08395 [Undibacterium sp. TC4M20W]|uniref:hypothetical protein n=1 Tax=Undibacterium sp. TC4M20W TaxID=3413052 RepID=UPI003BF09AE7
MDAQISGTKTLLAQQTAINFSEQANNVKLFSYHAGNEPFNNVVLHEVSLAEEIIPLELVELSEDKTINKLVATYKEKNKSLLFFNAIYVEGNKKMVAGFR